MFVAELKAQITTLEQRISEVQGLCSHPLPARYSITKSDRGNYDRSLDGSWTEHHCRLCDKRWSEDQ